MIREIYSAIFGTPPPPSVVAAVRNNSDKIYQYIHSAHKKIKTKQSFTNAYGDQLPYLVLNGRALNAVAAIYTIYEYNDKFKIFVYTPKGDRLLHFTPTKKYDRQAQRIYAALALFFAIAKNRVFEYIEDELTAIRLEDLSRQIGIL